MPPTPGRCHRRRLSAAQSLKTRPYPYRIYLFLYPRLPSLFGYFGVVLFCLLPRSTMSHDEYSHEPPVLAPIPVRRVSSACAEDSKSVDPAIWCSSIYVCKGCPGDLGMLKQDSSMSTVTGDRGWRHTFFGLTAVLRRHHSSEHMHPSQCLYMYSPRARARRSPTGRPWTMSTHMLPSAVPERMTV